MWESEWEGGFDLNEEEKQRGPVNLQPLQSYQEYSII